MPSITAVFGVTVDSLMGLDAARKVAVIRLVLEKYHQSISRGDIDGCIAIAREGLKEHPGSYVLMNKLMYALFVSSDDTGNIPDWKENMEKYDEEINRLGERIMKYCPDIEIRQEAMARLAFNHCEMGRKKQGRAVYEMLPSMKFTREEQIWPALEEDECAENARMLIREGCSKIRRGVWNLLECGDISDEEKEEIALARVTIDRVIYGKNPPPNIGQWRVKVAQVFARLGKTEGAIAQLNIAADQAKAFDARPESGCCETPLVGRCEWKRSDYETADSRPVSQIMRDDWMKHEDFDSIRATEAFKKIENLLGE